MSDGCNHDCGNCSEKCSSTDNSPFEKQNELSNVKKVIGVVSGKGGVGKSLVTSMLATLSQRKGNKTAILDADITGPSIPKAFGVTKKATAISDNCIFPEKTKTGLHIMSINLLIEDETRPVIWRGPILAGTVKQFWSDVAWGDIDYMYVDMPPGTGDVPLTVYQSLPIDGIVVVASPQELVGMIVEKAVIMANMLNIPILGIVENMSYYVCPKCKEKLFVFGQSKLAQIAAKYNVTNTAQIPINPDFSAQTDRGLIELFEGDFLDEFSDNIEKAVIKK